MTKETIEAIKQARKDGNSLLAISWKFETTIPRVRDILSGAYEKAQKLKDTNREFGIR